VNYEQAPDNKNSIKKKAAIVAAVIVANTIAYSLGAYRQEQVDALNFQDAQEEYADVVAGVQAQGQQAVQKAAQFFSLMNIQGQLDKQSIEKQLDEKGIKDVRDLVAFPLDNTYLRKGTLEDKPVECIGQVTRNKDNGDVRLVAEECIPATETPTPSAAPGKEPAVKGLEGLPVIQTSVR